MGKYRKKPVVIEAIQNTLENENEVSLFLARGGARTMNSRNFHTGRLTITIVTLEGQMEAKPDAWIIRGVKGEFYPCDEEIFAETYEPA